jgi:cell division protein FtsB
VAQATTAATSRAGQSRRAPTGVGRYAPRPHLGRLALLALVLIGASFYVSPLRDFFKQQDRYEKAAAELRAARLDNAALSREADLLITRAYIAQRARSDSTLVPPGTQLFVIKGLPGKEVETGTSAATPPVEASISVLDRIEDLWRTLLH